MHDELDMPAEIYSGIVLLRTADILQSRIGNIPADAGVMDRLEIMLSGCM